jgi:hypothetical protein
MVWSAESGMLLLALARNVPGSKALVIADRALAGMAFLTNVPVPSSSHMFEPTTTIRVVLPPAIAVMLSAKAGLRTITMVSVPGFVPPVVMMETLYELTFERALAELDRSPTLGSGAALAAALAAGADGAADGWDDTPAEAGVPPLAAAAAGAVVADELPHAARRALTPRTTNTG